MVNIQQRALSAFEHDVFALTTHVVQHGGHVGHHRLEQLGVFHALVERLLEVDGRLFIVIDQHEVVVIQQLTELGGETLTVEQITNAQTTTRYLVFISRANATASGADLRIATGFLTGLIEGHVVRQDQRAGWADTQTLAHRHTLLFQFDDFTHQRIRRNYHAVADQALHVFAQDAGGDQVQNGFFAVDYQGVASIVTTLITHNSCSLFGQQVDDLALAFIAPLGAQDYDILTHNTNPLRKLDAGHSRRKLFARPLRLSVQPTASGHHATAADDHSLQPRRQPRPAQAMPGRRADRPGAGA